MSHAIELQALLDGQPKPDCAKLTPFVVEEANCDTGHVKLRFAAQPAFKNHFGNIQGGFAVAMIDALVSIAAFAKTRAWFTDNRDQEQFSRTYESSVSALARVHSQGW